MVVFFCIMVRSNQVMSEIEGSELFAVGSEERTDSCHDFTELTTVIATAVTYFLFVLQASCD